MHTHTLATTALPTRPAAPRARVLAVRAAADSPQPPKVSVRFSVEQKVPFGQRVAVLGSKESLGAWSDPLALTWGEGDVWTGSAEVEEDGCVDLFICSFFPRESGSGRGSFSMARTSALTPLSLSFSHPFPSHSSSALEYKLLTIGDDGAPITWQTGPNRALDLSGAAAGTLTVKDTLEGEGGPVVEAAAAVKKAAPAPAPAPAPVATIAAAAPAKAPTPTPMPTPTPSIRPPPFAAVVAAAAASPAASVPLTSLTVNELKAKLKASGKPVTGTKAVLIERLQKVQRG